MSFTLAVALNKGGSLCFIFSIGQTGAYLLVMQLGLELISLSHKILRAILSHKNSDFVSFMVNSERHFEHLTNKHEALNNTEVCL